MTGGRGLISGHLKGFGYVQFAFEYTDARALSLPSISFGTIDGRFTGQGIASPSSFEGAGVSSFISGASILSLGNWSSRLWEGRMAGVSIGLDIGLDVSGGGIGTYTTIIFPEITPRTRNIFENYYDY